MMKTSENKRFDGGPSGARSRDLRIKRPDHQGARSNGNSASVAIGPDTREPSTAHAKQNPHDPTENVGLRPGLAVVVTRGLASGKRGVLREMAKTTWDGEPMWCVDLGMPEGVRVIRADYLRRGEP